MPKMRIRKASERVEGGDGVSVLIKNMEMPSVCAECFMDPLCGKALYGDTNIWKERHPDCPLIEVKEPHGDLVDKDKLMTEVMDRDLDHLQRDDWKEVIQIVSDADVVIESEGSE